ncbi:MAG: glycoside hydrolase family 2 protein [Ignavibacteriales bacterium]|nr:glycoside hydrolase family 2 protein [Ignavibacteriales bacterium]
MQNIISGSTNMIQVAAKTILLEGEWSFRRYGDAEWLSAQVPGCVHEDLLRHGKIPDPYLGTNETKVQWVENEDWEYTINFTVDAAFLEQYNNAEMLFIGLDTYADVFLNETRILSADNMFRSWEMPVKHLLQPGKNNLLIRFHSPMQVNLPKLYTIPYALPAANDAHTYKVSVFARKAPYHFGWDWGPRLVTSGIRHRITLTGWNTARITNLQILQPDITVTKAELIARVHIQQEVPGKELHISLPGFADTTFTPRSNSDVIDIPFTIANPRLWYPLGYGKPELYTFTAKISAQGTITSTTSVITGLRSIKLVQEPDKKGNSYFFTVNGIAVFAKGADYIPQDNMIGRVTEQRYKRLINDVCNANMNMLRVWGGGYYEDETFYRLCDERGILVWQDFMFACSMYPGGKEFFDNIAHEAREQVIRLSNHPSVAIWVGNNEVDVAWKNWGWQEQFMLSPKDSVNIKQDYDTIFKSILPTAVGLNDINKAYMHTTPLSNWGKPEYFNSGSMHYWGVWHGDEPFSAFKNNVPRFMAEYGFQSFPTMPAIRQFVPDDEMSYNSETMKLHQKSYKGNKTILKYLEPLYGKPKDFLSFVFLSHLTQAEGIAYAIRCHRLQKGHCMGTLYWQLDDSWYGPSWSAIDYTGRKKALYYFSKNMYKPVIAIIEQLGEQIVVSAVADTIEPVSVKAEIDLLDFTGKNLFHHETTAQLATDKATRLYAWNAVKMIPLHSKKRVLARVRLYSAGQLVDEQLHYFVIPEKMQLPKPVFSSGYDETTHVLTIKAQTFLKNLYVQTETDGIDFSDNYIDMLPGEVKEIHVTGCSKEPDIHIFSLWDILHK